MKKPALFGSIAAALLVASPAIALTQNNGNGYGGGNNGIYNSYRGGNGGGFGNNNNGNNNQSYRQAYSEIGQGGFSGQAMPIRNGNNGNGGGNGGGWFGGNNGGNGNGNNNASMRPSQRNNLLADNGDVRASHMIGTSVFNDRNNNLGTIKDVLIGRNGVWAVVATNNKKVAVPFQDFVFGNANANGNDKLVLPQVTQAELNRQPVFHYHLNNYAGYNGNGGNNG